MRQEEVDAVRFNALAYKVHSLLQKRGVLRGSVQHVWFPEDSTKRYEIREGNPPADQDRPTHLQRLRLEVDSTLIPKHVREVLEPGGLMDTYNTHQERQHAPKITPPMALRMLLELKQKRHEHLEEEEARMKRSYDRAAPHFPLQRQVYH